MQALCAGAAILSAACAARPVPPGAVNTTREVLTDERGTVYRTTDAPTAMGFTTPPDSTFRAVVAAYATLGFDAPLVDPSGRVIARQKMLFRSRFQGNPLSSIFDCGTGMLGARADQGRILADITTRVVPSGSGSSVSTIIQAALTPNEGASRDPVHCVSNGQLEERLRREVTLNLGLPYERY